MNDNIKNRYFVCDKFKCDLKVERCEEMRNGDKKRKECRGCKQYESLTLENTVSGERLIEKAEAQIKAEPERRIKDLSRVGSALAYTMKNRVSKR